MTEARNITMPVTGMTCANCAATIERNVRKLPGISVANVNLDLIFLLFKLQPRQLTHQIHRLHADIDHAQQQIQNIA